MKTATLLTIIHVGCLTLLFVFNMQKKSKIKRQTELIELQQEVIDLQERRIEQLEAVCP